MNKHARGDAQVTILYPELAVIFLGLALVLVTQLCAGALVAGVTYAAVIFASLIVGIGVTVRWRRQR